MPDASIFQLDYPTPDIAVITINDPAKGVNILSRGALGDLERLLNEVEKRSGIAGLVIRSTKPGNFIAGADLREFVADIDAPKDKVIELSRRGQRLFGRLSKMKPVTVAAIDGSCVGGGA
jgi:3-hydroxyacyl-CoA dehydrogenase/enoyl-CoA hydratase/3-hydroxybutyryl-CoA epimerase/3-hydroxyacyl-CoA dehydrogenase/enoyl-CoA hydratase/3-hydroxybutyryl-CoA epimerase/enoyl-CoA isomerase